MKTTSLTPPMGFQQGIGLRNSYCKAEGAGVAVVRGCVCLCVYECGVEIYADRKGLKKPIDQGIYIVKTPFKTPTRGWNIHRC